MLFIIGIVDTHFRVHRIETFQQSPGGQRAAYQVREPSLGQLIQRDDAEELLREDPDLGEGLLAYVLRQCRFQLLMKIGFAGRAEERHRFAPFHYSGGSCSRLGSSAGIAKPPTQTCWVQA